MATGILRAREEPTIRTLLVIDDEAHVLTLFQITLEAAGYRVLTAESGPHGLRLLQHEAVDLFLVDIYMPGMDGVEVIQRIRTSRPTSKIIAMSGGSGGWEYLDAAKHLGANDTLRKPFSLPELLGAVSAQFP